MAPMPATIKSLFAGHGPLPIRLNSRNVRVKTGGAHALEIGPQLGTRAGDRSAYFVLIGCESRICRRCRVPAMAGRDMAGGAGSRGEPGDVRRRDPRS